jgi:hypothetical protein
MANGTFGTRKPANITSADVDMFYYYRPSRSSESTDFPNFQRLDSSLLANSKGPMNDGNDTVSTLTGMYDLRLPLNLFGKVGIYTIYIKPKEVYGTITDVSTLAAYPNISGIVLDATSFYGGSNAMFVNGNLTGYRVEYFDDDNKTRNDIYRIITSSNRCEPVAQNLNDSTAKGIRYRYNDSSNLVFCTLTPSMEMSFKSGSTPYIGKVGQKIALVNTKFNPVMLEVEMVQHDIDSVYALQANSQIRDLNNGIITTFDDNGNIIEQALYGNITNDAQNINHDFKIKKTDSILFNQETAFTKISQNV